ncbi:Peptidase S74 domain-containing protein [Entamoeba marina]
MSNTHNSALVLVDSNAIPRTQTQRKKNWKCTFPDCKETPKTRYNCYAHVWDSHLRTLMSQEENNPENIMLTTFKNSSQKNLLKKYCEQYMIKLVDKIPPTKPKHSYPFAFGSEAYSPKSLSNDVDGTSTNDANTHENSFSGSLLNGTNTSESNHYQSFETQTSPIRSDQQFISTDSVYASQLSPNINGNDIKIEMQSPQTVSFQQEQTQPIQQQTTEQMYQMQQEIDMNQQQEIDMNQHQFNQENQVFNNFSIQLPFNNSEQFSPDDFVKIEKINENLRQLHVFGEMFAENGFLVRSDARFKTDISEIQSALDGVTSLVGVSYAYKNNPDDKKFGLIAQQVQKIYPDLVKEADDGTLSVDYLGVIPIIVQALKEIHSNAQGLGEVEEISEVSTRAGFAMDRLEKLLFEIDCKNIQTSENSKFEQWKYRATHVFGPTSFLVFSCLFSTIITIVIPVVFSSLYFLMCSMVILSVILWLFVFINRHEAMLFLTSKRAFFSDS